MLENSLAVKNTRIRLLQGDITLQETDAIVNAANSGLMGGGGVDGAIHRAGGPAILEECKNIVSRIGSLESGKAVITTGGRLKARYVIHTVGPIWHGGTRKEAEVLSSAYLESLKLATAYKLESVSFPSISTGAYGYPLDQASTIAAGSVIAFLDRQSTSLKEIFFVLFDATTFNAYHKSIIELGSDRQDFEMPETNG
jgi:O-acetyl-ADP-ribose deacetylase